MAQKHYHNDFKKLNGIDESRTASEKILDKVMRGRESSLPVATHPEPASLPRKKVKREGEDNREIKSAEILDKLMKTVAVSNNSAKVEKGLSVLLKCLGEE
jgi:hypothetical protein